MYVCACMCLKANVDKSPLLKQIIGSQRYVLEGTFFISDFRSFCVAQEVDGDLTLAAYLRIWTKRNGIKNANLSKGKCCLILALNCE